MKNRAHFDELNPRRNTRSVKWDTHGKNGIHPDAYPLWVADMDFKTLPAITQALTHELEGGIYGYSFETEDYKQALVGWLKRRHHWVIDPTWIFTTPGVVSAVNASLQALTQEGEGILIQEPVYHPFKASILQNKRLPISSELILNDGHYSVDFKDFEEKAKHAKLFIVCNPHNPVGKVFTTEELSRMVDICKKYDVLIISDEIHQDFVYKPHVHHNLANVRPDYVDHILTLVAASKTFNLAAFKVSQMIVSNPELLTKIKAIYSNLGIHGNNTLGLLASEIAYTQGDDFVDDLIEYLEESISWVHSFLQTELPQVKLIEPQGLYLLWLDFRDLHLSQDELKRRLNENAHLWLNDGVQFGSSGTGFMRLNLALPQSELKKVFNQLKKVLL